MQGPRLGDIMNREVSRQWFKFVLIAAIGMGAISWAGADTQGVVQSDTSSAAALRQDQGAPRPTSADALAGPHATKILGLCDDAGTEIDGQTPSSLGLRDVLWVVVQTSSEPGDAANQKPAVASPCKGSATPTPGTSAAAIQLDAGQYALFFNGRELEALDGTVYDSSRHAFGFRLSRNDQNKAIWTGLLGAPTTTLHRSVVVALGMRVNGSSPQPTIAGDGMNATFQIQVFSWHWLLVAVAVGGFVLFLVWGNARKRSTLRDNLLPQLDVARQPYSLARWQMAFWFTLIFTSFVFLFVLLWDTNTVSTQALSFMGISGVTALASVSIDAYKDSPADAANRGLQALGLHSCEDVARVKQEIATRQTELATLPPPPAATPSTVSAGTASSVASAVSATERRRIQLQTEIEDRTGVLRMYEDHIRPFVSRGWFRDITTDLNGTALHRLQTFCWTVALGAVFLISVYRELSMPDFNGTLLALMGISSAGYIGLKIPESNN
jgi:hypothetical protein